MRLAASFGIFTGCGVCPSGTTGQVVAVDGEGRYAGLVMGMFRTGGPGTRGVSAFLIEPELKGIAVERVT